ncbi:MAG TPA: hypothetical protein VL361_27455 [Candidatus Limnocylindrales bacterium]|nr:hypothetical protein [Candidatus Limnocylindrales bacterium]
MQPASNFEEFASVLREFMRVSLPSRQSCRQGLDTTFNRLAVGLFRLQLSRNPVYRTLCQSRGLRPVKVTHWSEIPSLPTAAFKDVEVSCLSPEARTNIFHSSGTTEQQPSRHFHDPLSLNIYEASLWPWFEQHLIPDLNRANDLPPLLLCLTPSSGELPHSSLGHMFATIAGNYKWQEAMFVGRLTAEAAWAVNAQAAVTALKRATEGKRAVVILGTAFSYVHLLDHFRDLGLRFQLPPGSRAMETGGYKGRSRTLTRAELHALITEMLGICANNIVCEYGMTELSSQAYDRVAAGNLEPKNPPSSVRAFHFPPWARAQIISPETGREVSEGETGLIRVFDLANVHSVLAIQTEDLGIRRGNGFELIGRAKLAEPRGCSLAYGNK